MKCIRLDSNMVMEIFSGSKEELKDTFHPGILDMCVEADDQTEVSPGWSYDPVTGTFAPPPEDMSDIDILRVDKLAEMGAACQAAIYAGVAVNGEQYALNEHDQIELMVQQAAIQGGAEAVPYHADGQLCRMYPAAEFLLIAQAAAAHIFYHRTYCNHLNVWIRRTDDPETLVGIAYGAALPEDLAANMAGVLAGAEGGV